jgi:hypothetical protein
MYRAIIRATSQREAMATVRQAMYEVAFEARARLLSGPYTTGTLADSIEQNGPVATPGRVFGSVGSNLPYAQVVHDGSPIHQIFPKSAKGIYRFGSRKRPQLRFFWRKRGRVVYLPHIPGSLAKIGRSHPGMAGKKYLSEPLRRIGRRHGFRVIVYDI